MSLLLAPGTTGTSLTVLVVTDAGLPVAGLVAATFPAVYYARPRSAAVAVPLADLVALTDAWIAGGVKEVGGGRYRLDLPDGAAAALAVEVLVYGEAAGKRLLHEPIQVGYTQSGDAFARLGAGGAGLTALGDARLANLDAAVSSRNAVAPDNAGIAAIQAKTVNLPASPAAVGSPMTLAAGAVTAGAVTAGALNGKGDWVTAAGVPTTAQIADRLLLRAIAGGADGGRTVAEALAAQRNRVAFDVPAAGQFTVFAADDTTPLWTGTYTASFAADPVLAIDPS